MGGKSQWNMDRLNKYDYSQWKRGKSIAMLVHEEVNFCREVNLNNLLYIIYTCNNAMYIYIYVFKHVMYLCIY